MASAWITSIENNSSHPVRFIQVDRNMHPVIETSSHVNIVDRGIVDPQKCQVRSGETIEVLPKGRLTANWFAIPWQGWGTLEIAINHSLVYTVGPSDGKDYLIVSGQTDKRFLIGGEGMWENVAFKVSIDDAKGIVFEPVDSVGYTALQYLLAGIAFYFFQALLYSIPRHE
jgi:hypothetical protein